jgi:hypothetical protein
MALSGNKEALQAARVVNRFRWHCATPVLWHNVTSCSLQRWARPRRLRLATMVNGLTFFLGSADFEADDKHAGQ